LQILGIRLRLVLVYTCFGLSLWQAGGYLKLIFFEGCGKNGSTVAVSLLHYSTTPPLKHPPLSGYICDLPSLPYPGNQPALRDALLQVDVGCL